MTPPPSPTVALQQFLTLPRHSHQPPPVTTNPQTEYPLYATRADTTVHFDLIDQVPPLFPEHQQTLPGTPCPPQPQVTDDPGLTCPADTTPDITVGRTDNNDTGDTALATITTALSKTDHDYSIMFAELHWQWSSIQDVKAFRTETLQTQDLCVFVFMRPNFSLLNFLHSVASFYAPNAPPDLRGKGIGFGGDKTTFQTPTAVLLPPEKPW